MDLFHPFITGEVEGGYNYLTVEAYTSYGPRARLGLDSPLFTKKLKAARRLGLERLDFRHISPLIDPTLADAARPRRRPSASACTAGDRRSTCATTRSSRTLGVYAEVRVDEGTRYAGGALRLTPRSSPSCAAIVPVPSRGSCSPAARATGAHLRRHPGHRALLLGWLDHAARLRRAPARAVA